MTAAAPKRTQVQRRLDAETRLLESSLTLLVERGYDRFALAEVGELAGYSRGLAAHHFENKDGLLEALTDYIVSGFAKGLKKQADTGPGWPTIERNIRYYTSSPRRNPRLFRAYMIILSEAVLRQHLATIAEDVHKRAVAQLVEQIEEGKAAGNIRADVDGARTAETIYAFQRGLMSLALQDNALETDGIVDTFIAAMSAHIGKPGTKGRAAGARS